jgi:hypothetical protein
MGWELHAYAVSKEGAIDVKHIFYGETREEADANFDAHVSGCPMFGPAEREHRMITFWKEVDELPTPQSADDEAEEGE